MLSCLPIYQRTFYPLEGYFRLLPTSLPSQSGCKDTTTSFTSKYFLIFFTKIFLEQPIHPDYQYFITKFYFKIFFEMVFCPILFRNSIVRFRSFNCFSQAQCIAPRRKSKYTTDWNNALHLAIVKQRMIKKYSLKSNDFSFEPHLFLNSIIFLIYLSPIINNLKAREGYAL